MVTVFDHAIESTALEENRKALAVTGGGRVVIYEVDMYHASMFTHLIRPGLRGC